jgi:AraC-like DNA-binding protein
MHSPGVIAASIIDGVLTTIDNRGMDAGPISARVGVANGGLFGRSHFLPLSTFTTILEMASLQTNDPVLGIKLGKLFDFESLGSAAQLFLSARTVGDGLSSLVEYFPTVQSNTRCALEVSDGVARLSYSISDRTVTHRIQDANFSEALFYSVLQACLGRDWQPICLEFEHSAGANLASYREQFDCPLRFGTRYNAILFPVEHLDQPVASFDPMLHLHLENELSKRLRFQRLELDLSKSIKAWISAALCNSASIDIQDAASDFGMSVRSFQRKLADAGLSYADLRNSVRTEIAKAMLGSTSLSIPEIAVNLGFSETSAFSRSFKSFTGATPARFRENAAWAAAMSEGNGAVRELVATSH